MDCSMPDLPVAYHLSVCPSSCPLNRWCHPTISSFVAFSFCLHSFSASGSFPMSWLFASSGQNIEASSSASVLPKTIQGWFTLGLTGLISLVWSLWLQTLNCNSLLILNKPVFPREIPVSPFTCLSGQHFGGPCGDQRRSSKAPNIVSKQMWYPQLTPIITAFSLTLAFEGTSFSWIWAHIPFVSNALQTLSGIYFKWSFWLSPFSVCRHLFGTSVWFSD